ncbi:hypothetical protein ACBI99_10615 [Nonomuraea sp. ATR24]|uniref:hypothetical protein n=1 Tax=Nonomuraea TaxID=83681 RepID=UPI001C5D1FCF|nr:hypothetical protein [Nonomuraea ceibae]
MDEERRTVPFECRSCWHVWEEDYLVRHVPGRHGAESEVWMRGGVAVPPPAPSGVVCPRCGCQGAVMFPDGYLAHHPELVESGEPAPPDPTPLLSPVPKRFY